MLRHLRAAGGDPRAVSTGGGATCTASCRSKSWGREGRVIGAHHPARWDRSATPCSTHHRGGVAAGERRLVATGLERSGRGESAACPGPGTRAIAPAAANSSLANQERAGKDKGRRDVPGASNRRRAADPMAMIPAISEAGRVPCKWPPCSVGPHAPGDEGLEGGLGEPPIYPPDEDVLGQP